MLSGLARQMPVFGSRRAFYSVKVDMKMMKVLRSQTKAGIKDCIDALVQSENNIEKAMDYLQLQAKNVFEKKCHRVTSEGIVAAVTDRFNNRVSAVELLCETDFASRGTFFVQSAIKLAQIALTLSPKNKSDFVEFEEVKTHIENIIYTLKENVQIRRLIVEHSDVIGLYAHKKFRLVDPVDPDVNRRVLAGNKLGIVPLDLRPRSENSEATETAQKLADQLAAHVVCMKPVYLTRKNLNVDVENNQILMEQDFALSEEPLKISQLVDGYRVQLEKYNTDILLEKFYYIHYADAYQ